MKIGTKVRTTRRNGQKITGVIAGNSSGLSGKWVSVKYGDPKKPLLLKTRESQVKAV